MIMLSILTTVRSLNKNILFFKKVDKVKIFEKMKEDGFDVAHNEFEK